LGCFSKVWEINPNVASFSGIMPVCVLSYRSYPLFSLLLLIYKGSVEEIQIKNKGTIAFRNSALVLIEFMPCFYISDFIQFSRCLRFSFAN